MKAIFWALAALLLAGCAQPHVKVGPHPARVEVALSASQTQAMIDDAVLRHVGPLPRISSAMDEISQPFWQVRLFLVDGPELRPLPAAGGLAMGPAEGAAISGLAVWRAPPGLRRYRLLIEATVWHYWYEGLRRVKEPVPVGQWSADYDLMLHPEGVARLEPPCGLGPAGAGAP